MQPQCSRGTASVIPRDAIFNVEDPGVSDVLAVPQREVGFGANNLSAPCKLFC